MQIKRIDTAYNTLSGKEFVDWALKNNYYYFIVIGEGVEKGYIYNRKGTKMYNFNHKI